MTGSIKGWLLFVLAAVAIYGGYSGWRIRQRMQDAEEYKLQVAAEASYPLGGQVEPFKLTERSGAEFNSRELNGKVWVASFFFTSCAGACLRMNNTIARLHTELADSNVRFVSITVDPENDTPDVLEKYARHYSADPERWRFLTGPPEEIKHIAIDVFRVAYGRAAHSDRLIVVDREGKIQGTYHVMDDTEVVRLKRKLDELTKDRSEPRDSNTGSDGTN